MKAAIAIKPSPSQVKSHRHDLAIDLLHFPMTGVEHVALDELPRRSQLLTLFLHCGSTVPIARKDGSPVAAFPNPKTASDDEVRGLHA